MMLKPNALELFSGRFGKMMNGKSSSFSPTFFPYRMSGVVLRNGSVRYQIGSLCCTAMMDEFTSDTH